MTKKPEPAGRCPKCGQPHPRCAGHSKRHGGPCSHWPIKGGTVCRFHGGNAPQVAAAARRRLLAAEAGAQLDQLGVRIETTPIEALEAMLWEAAGNVAVLRQLVAQLGLHGGGTDTTGLYGELYHESGTPTGRALPNVLVVMYDAERDRLARLAEACAKLGLDERRVRLVEHQVEQLLAHVTGAIADVGLDAAQTSRFKQALATRIRGTNP